MSLIVHKPGLQSTIQDAGREGFRKYGVPAAGPMDFAAAQLSQTLCNNYHNQPFIELTLHGAIFEFEKTAVIALTGGGATALLNDTPLPYFRSAVIKAGSILKFCPAQFGCRTYLSVQGGFNIPQELGSTATYLPGKLGGIMGRAIKAGDRIEFNLKKQIEEKVSDMEVELGNPALFTNQVTIRFTEGPEWSWFSAEEQNLFLHTKWMVHPQSNRVAYLLEGDALALTQKRELISTAVMPGLIQVTPAGIPYILMADAQTIGGYPRLARIKSEDRNRLAQCRPGYQLNFQKI
ncbi:MAG: biotin-dependent carboxyltransferase family protein [Bacteroidetes bacterium]|nr:biotin-dependent carboxyltransferase family protein [Bacteroidota bacterium]